MSITETKSEDSERLESVEVARQENTNRPIETMGRGYITSDNCRECHTSQYDSWHASHHRTMTQVPTQDSVIADFENRVLIHSGKKFRFFHEEDEYFMEITSAGPEEGVSTDSRASLPNKTFKVVLSTGAHHQQGFWCETDRGRTLSTIPFIWINKEQRWVPYRSIFIGIPSSAGLRMHSGMWNSNCIKCHVVNGRPRFNAEKSFDTRVAEFGISCEACHGPGEAHATAQGRFLNEKQHDSAADIASIVNPAKLTHERSSQVCGQCHAVFDFYDAKSGRDFNENGFAFRPGEELTDTRHVFRVGKDKDLLTVKHKLKRNPKFYEQQYWSDGMVRVSGREYNGLLETACYQRGTMSCLSCHDMHPQENDHPSREQWADDQLKPKMRGNSACVQCHKEYESEKELVMHTHHPAKSSGSNCYNCHMPHTTLGLMKAMRSHTIDSPNVANTVATGRPNACNLCHLDKTLAWTADYLQQWYKIPSPELSRQQQEIASSVRWILQGDAGQRAIAGWHFGWQPAREISGTRWMAPYLAELLTDSYAVVRFIGYHSLRELPNFADFVYDFVGSSDSQQQGRNRVRKQWGESDERPLPAKAVLINDQSVLDEEEFRGIRNQRLDLPVILVE